MFGRKNRQQPTEPQRAYAPQQRATSHDGQELPGLAGYINQGSLEKGKLHMPPNRFTYKRPDGRPD
jgi:hypothetical protein